MYRDFTKGGMECKNRPVQVNETAPHFHGSACVNGEIKDIDLKDYNGKFLVLLFYPFDFTGVCGSEVVGINQMWKEFQAADISVVAVSCDSAFSHQAWQKADPSIGGIEALNFPVLSDFSKEITKSYGVMHEPRQCAFRATFIIDPKGKVRQITVNDLPIGRSVEELLRTVKAYQFFENNGEACTAGWRPKK